MNDLFNAERYLSDSEVIYQITNNKEKSEFLGNVLKRNEYLDIDEVCEMLTPARRDLAKAIIELYKRMQGRKDFLVQIRNSEHIYKAMKPEMEGLQVEECWAIFLNQSARIIRKVRISQGGLASTQVDIRLILAEALKVKATSLVLVHNHPSGNIHPSGDDDRLTKSLFDAAKILNIRMLDHVVFTDTDYYSYADEGRI